MEALHDICMCVGAWMYVCRHFYSTLSYGSQIFSHILTHDICAAGMVTCIVIKHIHTSHHAASSSDYCNYNSTHFCLSITSTICPSVIHLLVPHSHTHYSHHHRILRQLNRPVHGKGNDIRCLQQMQICLSIKDKYSLRHTTNNKPVLYLRYTK